MGKIPLSLPRVEALGRLFRKGDFTTRDRMRKSLKKCYNHSKHNKEPKEEEHENNVLGNNVMSDHTISIVPIESWCYMSPELIRSGEKIDIGLFAEALIYYERVYVIPTTESMLNEFLAWFINQGKYNDFLALLKDGVINFYHYAFASTAARLPNGKYVTVNLQDEEQAATPTFEKRFLSTERLSKILPHTRERAKLYKNIDGKIKEVKAADLGAFILNARDDYHDPHHASFLVQSFINEIYPMLGKKEIPEVKAVVTNNGDDFTIKWNISFDEISKWLGKNLNFRKEMPLIGQIQCNRLIWSAANLGCDLYLGTPMSVLVGDKLYESNKKAIRPQLIIDDLITEVEFPNVRQLVNNHQIGLDEVLRLRKNAGRFRTWLQDESYRDRNALIAYHTEISRESGWTKGARKTLKLFGSIFAPAAGALLGSQISGVDGAIIGAVSGGGVDFLIEIASKIDDNWKPVVFGNWARDKVSTKIKTQEKS